MENKVSQIPEFKRYYLSEFELNGRLYFEYGAMFEHVHLDDFEEVA